MIHASRLCAAALAVCGVSSAARPRRDSARSRWGPSIPGQARWNDADKQEFKLLDVAVTSTVSDATRRRLDPAQVRRYRLEGDVLTISLIGAGGQPTAITVFRRAP